jgi:hypothetical protein
LCYNPSQPIQARGMTMKLKEQPNRDTAILGRLVGPDGDALSPAAAEGILALTFGPADKARMHALAARAQAGTLTAEELAEVEAYSRINSLLGILKAKARRALKGRRANGKSRTR